MAIKLSLEAISNLLLFL